MRVWNTMKTLCIAGLALSASACGLLEHAACDPHCHASRRALSRAVVTPLTGPRVRCA